VLRLAEVVGELDLVCALAGFFEGEGPAVGGAGSGSEGDEEGVPAGTASVWVSSPMGARARTCSVQVRVWPWAVKCS
jgi:hypothetical protein